MQWRIVFLDMHIIFGFNFDQQWQSEARKKHNYFPFEDFVGNSAKHFESGTQLRRLMREMILA